MRHRNEAILNDQVQRPSNMIVVFHNTANCLELPLTDVEAFSAFSSYRTSQAHPVDRTRLAHGPSLFLGAIADGCSCMFANRLAHYMRIGCVVPDGAGPSLEDSNDN